MSFQLGAARAQSLRDSARIALGHVARVQASGCAQATAAVRRCAHLVVSRWFSMSEVNVADSDRKFHTRARHFPLSADVDFL